jgi:hypothetical protein
MSSTDPSPPFTSMRTDRSLVSMRPEASIAFWPARAAWMSSAESPRSASAAEETSMKMRSSWSPSRSTLATPGMRSRRSRALFAKAFSSG